MKRSEEPTPAGTSLQVFPYRSYTCERIPRDVPAADKPLFPPSFVYIIPPEKPFAEHEAAPVGPIKRRKKRSLKPPVHLYQLFYLFP
ncbi:MAG: hypothetical protein ACO2PM_05315 [Pyrobaculum sp.]